jgi:hypothetical protein
MDNMYLDTYYFFVPNRLVWKHWREFCGENTTGPWAPTVEYTIPKIVPPAGGFASGTLADYMGLPIGVEWKADDDLAPSALPFRGFALIMNEFFRDENLSDPLLIPMDDANQQGTNGDNYISDVANGGMPFRAAKYHDYFTSALPSPQKGEAVGVPITVPGFKGGTFPVTTSGDWSVPASAVPAVYGLFTTPSSGRIDGKTSYPVSTGSSGLQTGEKIMMSDQASSPGPVSTLVGTSLSYVRNAWSPVNLQTVIPPLVLVMILRLISALMNCVLLLRISVFLSLCRVLVLDTLSCCLACLAFVLLTHVFSVLSISAVIVFLSMSAKSRIARSLSRIFLVTLEQSLPPLTLTTIL